MIAPPYRALLLVLSAIAVAPPVEAADFADPAAIDRDIAAFVGSATGGLGSASPIDRRLHLTPCAAPLALSWRGDHHDTILVECPDPGSWHLFVPIHTTGAPSGIAAVKRGEEVTVSIAGDGFTVSQSGEALDSGVIGDWIRINPVKDAKTASEPIRAQIIRPGLVAVLLP